MNFYDRYAKCCAQKGILPASQDTANKIGCSRSAISAFSKSGINPKGDIVAGAANLLDVSADYLLGLIEVPRPLHSPVELTKEEWEAITALRSMNEVGVSAALAMLAGLSTQANYAKEGSKD